MWHQHVQKGAMEPLEGTRERGRLRGESTGTQAEKTRNTSKLVHSVVVQSLAQSCPALCHPMDFSLPASSAHGDSPGKNTGVGCHALLQGTYPTQGSNPGLPHCRWICYCLATREAQQILFCTNCVIR